MDHNLPATNTQSAASCAGFFLALALSILATLSDVRTACAQVQVDVEVAGSCANAEAIRHAVEARVPFEATVSVAVTCTPGIAVRIAIEAPGIAEVRTLAIAPEELAELADAIALVVLVALDPDGEDEDEPSDPPTRSDVTRATIDEADATDENAPESAGELARLEEATVAPSVPPTPWASTELHFGVLIGGGAFSDTIPGLLVGGAYRFTSILSLELDFFVWARQRISFDPHGRVDLFPWSFRFGPCVVGPIQLGWRTAIEIGACPALSVGATAAMASKFDGENLERWDPRVATSLRVRGALEFERILVGLEAEVGANLMTPTFYVLVDGTSRVFVDRPSPFFYGIAVYFGGRFAP